MTTLDELHLRYDSHISTREFAVAKAGGIENLERKEAADAVWLLRDEARFYIRAIRNSTTAGHAASLRQDLRTTWDYYRRSISRTLYFAPFPVPWTRPPDRRESLCLGGVMG